jgi:hypothetical protein
MIQTNSKVAFILGHPGHELRVYRFMELYKPRVYVLTDGSGPDGKKRVYNTLKLIRETGATAGPLMGRFTDAEIYRIMLEQQNKRLEEVVDEIVLDMKVNHIDVVAGDAIEGFNPTHDLCRYMINAIVSIYSRETNNTVSNFEFLLDGPPQQCPPELQDEALWVMLTDEEFNRKFEACYGYPEIIKDAERLYQKHGKLSFQTECLRPVKDLNVYSTWGKGEPYYETWGESKVNSGAYDKVITYRSHLLPLARTLTEYAQA